MEASQVIENPECNLCELHLTASKRSVCLKGRGGDAARIVCFLDSPNAIEDKRGRGGVSDGAEWLFWAFRRMSIPATEVYVDYVYKCFTGRCKTFGRKPYRQVMVEACSYYRFATLQRLQPRAIVVMGGKACEAFIGQDKVSDYEGARWTPWEPAVREHVSNVWVTFSPAYALQDPAESVGIFRTLWHAALDAGLTPKIDDNITPFDYGF